MNLSRKLGIEFLSVLGMPPLQFVALAVKLGCQQISTGLSPMTANPHNYPAWSMREDSRLRRDFRTVLTDCGIGLSVGEAFLILPQNEIRLAASDLDMMRDIGVPQVNVLAFDPDWPRVIAELALLTEMAQVRGMQVTLELLPGGSVGSLGAATSALAEVGNPNLRLALDAMHLYRSGASSAEIAALDPPLIGNIQLCDVPRTSELDYGEEATHCRLPLGEGELPLADFISVLPKELPIGLEIPMLGKAKAGVEPYERLKPCMDAARILCGMIESKAPIIRQNS